MNQNYEPVMLPPGVKYTAVTPPDTDEINKQHAELVSRLSKPGADIISGLDPNKMHLLHMVVGISGEAGELLDAVKKHCIYNKELDIENVAEEIGDLFFYIQGIINCLNLCPNRIKLGNMEKLNKRYKEKYSDQQAQERADKVQEPPPKLTLPDNIIKKLEEIKPVPKPNDEFPPYTPKLGDICYDLNRKRFYRVRAYTDPHTLEPNLFLLNRVYSDKVYDINNQVLVHVDPKTWNDSLEGTGLPPLSQEF